ncbi:radical SAM protein [Rhodothermaceae bacterium RA]|nr:radical SAM protein [Rhodothermaceae bacterium RA]
MPAWPSFSDAEILAARPPRRPVDPWRPYAFLTEPECQPDGRVEEVATLFLTNRECPFRCLMCDLWRHTTEATVPAGAIPAQIDHALARLPPTRHVKLYNSGNFFDRRAIPPADHAAIADRVQGFATVIVENHPKLCGEAVLRFRDRLAGRLEVAMGLETVHPEVLPRLNKRMTLEDYARAVAFLRAHDIAVRAFILLRPPFLSEAEGIDWALRSLTWAFDAGVECGVVIPTRPGNGLLERLAAQGLFEPPRLASLERVLEAGLRLRRGRVFVDLWDAERFFECDRCGPARRERLHRMNLTQTILPPVRCAGPCAMAG